ncbi:MAG: O-methyltransferase [Pseudoalteromonas tetraodonis]|jgi:O-methyltransferase
MSIKRSISKFIKGVQYQSPLKKYLHHHYEYFFNPCELWYLCECIGRGLRAEGSFLEIGCARGATTVFLNRHLDNELEKNPSLDDKAYHCIDTFSGFRDAQVSFEIEQRSKRGADYSDYALNDKKWFDQMLVRNRISRVTTHEADAAEFDYGELGNLAFVLLDVDLYLPTKSALEKIYPLLGKGGILIVDDCKPDNKYDGAEQAFREFVSENDIDSSIEFGKFGVIKG